MGDLHRKKKEFNYMVRKVEGRSLHDLEFDYHKTRHWAREAK